MNRLCSKTALSSPLWSKRAPVVCSPSISQSQLLWITVVALLGWKSSLLDSTLLQQSSRIWLSNTSPLIMMETWPFVKSTSLSLVIIYIF